MKVLVVNAHIKRQMENQEAVLKTITGEAQSRMDE